MARLMLSAGMFSALAATMAPRKRGLLSGSPPPFLAAMVISLIKRVNILPRLASSAPFLCLMVAHLEWPDIAQPHSDYGFIGLLAASAHQKIGFVSCRTRKPRIGRRQRARADLCDWKF